jgi:hypothetical protein
VPTVEKRFKCSGLTGSITLYQENIVVDSKELGFSKSYELPVGRIRAVMIERKSVIPFATLTVLAAIAAVVARYNGLWFLILLAPATAHTLSTIAVLVAVLCALPTLVRTLFVSVSISWDGEPHSIRVGLVPARIGKQFAKKLQELSAWS